MKNISKILISLSLVAGAATLTGCNDWVGDTKPTTILTADQVWNDAAMVESVLANLYNRVPANGSLDNDANLSLFDDMMWCGLMNADVENARNNLIQYGYGDFRYYDYAYIYEINKALECLQGSTLAASVVSVFNAELRFMRAYAYFRMVITMGGVPLITETQQYEAGMDVTVLRHARESEQAIYDFVYNECMDIDDALAANSSPSRANKYAALALACRSSLYAGSIAKYNAAMANPIVSTEQSGVVGMTGADPKVYYQRALDCAETIINDKVFALQGLDDPSADNFYNAVCMQSGNTEVIWAKHYSASKFHNFAFANVAQSMNEDNDNGSDLCPTLNLVETYQLLDGTTQSLKDKDADGHYIVYENRGDIFSGRDYRLQGTCLLPEQVFKGKSLDVLAGVAVYNGPNDYTLITGSTPNTLYEEAADHPNADGGKFVGFDGPANRATYTNTGFNLRKYVDESTGSSARGQGSYIWWVYFRMGEIYLNAAEAAMELNQPTKALGYVNDVRHRAGITTDWGAADLTIDNMLAERRRELACEDHRLWDLKRTRRATEIWDGNDNGTDNEPAMLKALWPYRIVGGPDNNKFIFVRQTPPRFKAPRFFRTGNYYTSFSTTTLSNNPLLVQNPNF